MDGANRGFTLIEVLVAAFILVIAITASAALFSTSISTNAGNRYRTVATTLLQDKMEELRHRKALDRGSYSELLAVSVTGTAQEFLRSWRIEAGSPCRVTVTVFRRRYGSHGPYDELARAATMVAPGF